jgi:acyl-CoA thioester hydrolase
VDHCQIATIASMESSKLPATQTKQVPHFPAAGPVMYQTLIPVRWGDLDAFQHVNNTIYFRYMEQCRLEWFETIGIDVPNLDRVDIVPNLVGAECRFMRAIMYPATVRVTIAIGEVGTKVVQTLHELWVGDTLHAVGDCKLLWMSRKTNRAVDLPNDVREKLLLPPSKP